jgi:hypothetical protein
MKVLSPQKDRRIRRVSDLLDGHGNWKEELIRTKFIPVDADLILNIKSSRRMSEDILAWQPEKSGIFSVRSAYKLAFNELPEQCLFPATSSRADGSNPCWLKIWSAKVPPKVKIFAWKAASEALPYKLKRGMHVTGYAMFVGWR